jgi:SAM-dependent MidA family methyltransferase
MNEKEKEKIESEYHRLTHPSEMGENFKVQLITLKQYGELYPWITEQDGVY